MSASGKYAVVTHQRRTTFAVFDVDP